jgi:hypothetical protein
MARRQSRKSEAQGPEWPLPSAALTGFSSVGFNDQRKKEKKWQRDL